MVPLSTVGATTPNGKGAALRSGPGGFPPCFGHGILRPQQIGARRMAKGMAQRFDKSKGKSKGLSPSRLRSTSRKLSRYSSINSEVDHPSPKSPSETQAILFPEIH